MSLQTIAARTILPGTLCLVSACAFPPRTAVPVPSESRVVIQPAPSSEAEQLLAFAYKFRKFDARESASDRESLRAIAARERTDFARIKLAIALSAATPLTAAEDAEILATLDPLMVNAPTADTELRALATMLHGAAAERRKLREQVRELQVKANQPRRDDAEIRALRAKVEELDAKLLALKSIDRSVNSRTEPK
jgi:hypothetical protein